jgi:hypothetical protein
VLARLGDLGDGVPVTAEDAGDHDRDHQDTAVEDLLNVVLGGRALLCMSSSAAVLRCCGTRPPWIVVGTIRLLASIMSTI